MSVSKGSAQRSALPNNILGKISQKPRFNIFACFSYQSCCLFIFLAIIALIICLTILVTQTGLVEIPLFTNLFYKEPQPIEVVSPALGFSWENKVSLESKSKEVKITFTQEELTNLVSQSETFSKAQIAIGDLEMELFALKKMIFQREAYLTIKFIPRVKNNKLDFKITQTKIGNLGLPTFLANFAKNILMEFYGDQLLMINKLNVNKIDIKKGELIIYTQPSVVLPK